MKFMRKIKNNLSTKYLIASSVIFGIAIVAINLASHQLTETVLDFRLGYSTETVYSFFEKIGHSGRSLYTLLLQIDFIFPIIYMTFGVCAISIVLKKYKNTDSILDGLLLFPVIAMICDWIENSLLLNMLTNYGKTTVDLGTLAATMTALKLILLLFFVGMLLVLSLLLFLKKHSVRLR